MLTIFIEPMNDNLKDIGLSIFSPEMKSKVNIPMAASDVAAGFPSPAADYEDVKLDLNRELIHNPASTFYARVSGLSMVDENIDDGDLLVVDKSIEPSDNCLAVCFLDGEFTLKRLQLTDDGALLIPANKNFEPIVVTADNEFQVWGVVTYIIKKM